jgi:DNA-binding transcriptional ArsR family regulator
LVTIKLVSRQAASPFEALADPHRRAILQLLHGGARSVREIADDMPITRPAVSRHLRLLKEAGLVTSSAAGTRRLYELHDHGVGAVRAYLEDVWGDAAASFRSAADGIDAV